MIVFPNPAGVEGMHLSLQLLNFACCCRYGLWGVVELTTLHFHLRGSVARGHNPVLFFFFIFKRSMKHFIIGRYG